MSERTKEKNCFTKIALKLINRSVINNTITEKTPVQIIYAKNLTSNLIITRKNSKGHKIKMADTTEITAK